MGKLPVKMTSFCVLVELVLKDAERTITATQKAQTTKVTHVQDTVHLTAKKKNSDVPSQTIQSQDVQFLHCALDSKTILDVILQTNASQPVSKPAPSNAVMMKSNAKVKLTVILTVLIKISVNLKQKTSMVMLAQMTLLLMDAQSTAVEILSCVHPKKML